MNKFYFNNTVKLSEPKDIEKENSDHSTTYS